MYKVALITAKKRDPGYLFQRSGIDLGTMSLEAYLAQKAQDVRVLVTEEVDDIVAFAPNLVGISATSENYPLAQRIAREVRQRCGDSVMMVAGGAHITGCPASLSKDFALGVRGEGEETFLEVVTNLKENRHQSDNYPKIKGIVYHGPEGLTSTPLRKPIANLGTLPLPNRAKWVDQIGLAFLMTLRGCPFHCWFCAARENYTGLRCFPVAHVIHEIKDIINHFHPRCIRIFDDVFNLDKKRTYELTSKMIREGVTKETSYMCWIRAELLDEEFVHFLKKANFVYVSFGIESASETLMKKMKGGRINLKIVQNAINLLYEAGIKVGCTFIIGIPGETAADLEETYNFIEKNQEKILDVEINPLIPLPATPLWEYAEQKGLVSKEMDWEILSDTGVLLNFNFDRYIYLNDDMPKETFFNYVEEFKGLYREITLRPENTEFGERTFPAYSFPARLKRFS